MCSIGKSVNLLRTHRNVEIQKKARSSVDTWKKRVQVELDTKYGPNQSVPWSDVAKCGIKHYRPSEVAVKSSATQFSATKTGFVKLFQGGTATKSASAMPVPMKASTLPASARTKARNATIAGTSDPQTTTRDEKINSSSQSHNNTLSQVAHHWKFINGLPGPLGVQRETGPCNNSSLHRNSAPGKVPQSSLTCEKAVDALIAEDQLVTNSRASSPVLSEKQEQFKHNMKEKSGTYQENVMTDVNNESWQSNDVKDLLTGSDEGESSPAAVPDEEYCRTGEDLKKITEVTKYTKANACMPVADGAGMNLLACVAAGEIPKSDVASAIDSPQRNESRR
ncbi:hypothetical protein Gotur_019501, partial [Gossypium turneri]